MFFDIFNEDIWWWLGYILLRDGGFSRSLVISTLKSHSSMDTLLQGCHNDNKQKIFYYYFE